MAECWEKHNRFLVEPESMAASYCIATEDGLALMVQHDVRYPGPVTAFILPAEEAELDFSGDRFALRFTVVSSDGEAVRWFGEMQHVRPWEPRH